MDDEVADAVAEYAVPLGTTTPDPGSPDGLADADAAVPDALDGLADADVVGLGEVTHGTRECFELKGRLVRWLVAERGFRTVAFEADVARTVALDAAVADPDGDPAAALAGLDKWQWQTESVLSLLSWVQAFNADRPADDRVRVRGVDLSDPSVPAAVLRALLDEVDVVPVPNDLATLAAAGAPPDDEPAREQHLGRAETVAATVDGRLDEHRGAVVDGADETTWRRLRELTRAIRANCEWHRVRHEREGPHPDGMAVRDEKMAAGVARCLDDDPGDGVAVWAHNGHVGRGTFDDGQLWTDVETMGAHLADELGDGYRVLGFDAGGGSARAQVRGEDGGPRECSLGPPADGSLTERLAAIARDEDGPAAPFALDLAAAGDDDRFGDLLAPDGQIRWVGSVFDPDADPGHHSQVTDLPATYDHLCFVSESTPTRPL